MYSWICNTEVILDKGRNYLAGLDSTFPGDIRLVTNKLQEWLKTLTREQWSHCVALVGETWALCFSVLMCK